ncbi:MAG TPA: hypothetical protein DDZ89_05590, partial [Clostridiales bacterium]|nr:hypothetical protein [Clostridiales bacterium]
MKYPNTDVIWNLFRKLELYTKRKVENGGIGIDHALIQIEDTLKSCINYVNNLPEESDSVFNEPNSLDDIKKLRPDGPRKI